MYVRASCARSDTPQSVAAATKKPRAILKNRVVAINVPTIWNRLCRQRSGIVLLSPENGMVFLAGCIRLLQAHFKLVVSQFAVAAIRQPTDSPS